MGRPSDLGRDLPKGVSIALKIWITETERELQSTKDALELSLQIATIHEDFLKERGLLDDFKQWDKERVSKPKE